MRQEFGDVVKSNWLAVVLDTKLPALRRVRPGYLNIGGIGIPAVGDKLHDGCSWINDDCGGLIKTDSPIGC